MMILKKSPTVKIVPLLKDIALKIRTLGLELLVIETQSKFISTGQELTNLSDGKYYHFPKATERQISAMMRGATAEFRAS
jgi:magnesium chelatase subunit D